MKLLNQIILDSDIVSNQSDICKDLCDSVVNLFFSAELEETWYRMNFKTQPIFNMMLTEFDLK